MFAAEGVGVHAVHGNTEYKKRSMWRGE